MAKTSKIAVPVPAQPERVDYDGCYVITAISKTGQVFKTYSRGYKLKSWLTFERSLGSEVSYQAVEEAEFEQHQWYNQPFEDETVPKKAAKSAKKAPAKKAEKVSNAKPKPATKPQPKSVKKSTKTAPKVIKKSTVKKTPIKK